MSVASIIRLVRERIADPERVTDQWRKRPFPAASSEQIAAAEKELGFRLPPVLKRLYTEVANGGFGPGYGLIGVDGCGTDERKNDLVALHRGQSSDHWKSRFPDWPPRILRIAYFGHAMYAAVDCSTRSYPVYLFEPNPSEEELGFKNCLVPFECSITDWLGAWAQGEDVQLPPALRDAEPDAAADRPRE